MGGTCRRLGGYFSSCTSSYTIEDSSYTALFINEQAVFVSMRVSFAGNTSVYECEWRGDRDGIMKGSMSVFSVSRHRYRMLPFERCLF
jgi:hypothetical protein